MKGGFFLKNRALFSLVSSMVIFGTIGILRRYIPLSSGIIAFSRGLIGFIFLSGLLFVLKKPFSFKKVGKKAVLLFVSGALMGFNWILLFEAYNYTSVATATLCYYMAPVFVILASPFVFGEKIGTKKLLCVFGAVLGMVFVSGIFESGFGGIGELKGIVFGIFAAVLYASVVIMNKKVPEIKPFDKTLIQLGSSAAVLLPYVIVTEDFSGIEIEPIALILLLVAGIVHTGISYALYFGSVGELPAQTTAIFSYIDPVTAIFLSAVFLEEKLGFFGAAGAFLILGSAFLSETEIKIKKKRV
ncbi:MAG: DMT family transporter [Ruminococcaceae bacterium]|nr:DMT family transporter [Oscillospiraceae bacterium]